MLSSECLLRAGPAESISQNIELSPSYPNPTAGEAIIPYSLPGNCKAAAIAISEVVSGRQVRSYKLQANESSLSVDLQSLSIGIYVYTLYVDEQPVATKKLSVIK